MGQRIARLRERAGLSQPQAAERAGIPVGTLRGWEQGRRVPLLDAAAKLADAIGCSLDDLAGRTPEPPAPAPPPEPAPVKPKPRRKRQAEGDE